MQEGTAQHSWAKQSSTTCYSCKMAVNVSNMRADAIHAQACQQVSCDIDGQHIASRSIDDDDIFKKAVISNVGNNLAIVISCMVY